MREGWTVSRPNTLPSPWHELADQLGGVGALQEVLGAPPNTLRRWSRGTARPNALTREAVEDLFRRHGLPPPRLAGN